MAVDVPHRDAFIATHLINLFKKMYGFVLIWLEYDSLDVYIIIVLFYFVHSSSKLRLPSLIFVSMQFLLYP